MPPPIRILLVEDNEEDAVLLGSWLGAAEGVRHDLRCVERVQEAEESLAGEAFDLVLVDLTLPDARGLEAVHRVVARAPSTPVVVLTGQTDAALAVEAVREGAQDYLVKSQIDTEALVRSISYAIERKRVEERLRRSEEQFRTFFDHAPLGMVVVDPQGRILRVNRMMVQMTGFSEEQLRQRRIARLLHPEEVGRALESCRPLLRGEVEHVQVELRFVRRDGGVELGMSGASVVRAPDGEVECLIVTVEPVTERRKLEVQLLQAQKMEAVGRLAGGIAHDFNNLLTAIVGYADLLTDRLADSTPGRDEVEEIRKAARRASALTQQLLTFSRRQVTQFHWVDPTTLVARMEDLLGRVMGEDVDLVLDLASTGMVRADPAQLEQVVLNLALNAKEAMPRGGRVRVSVRPGQGAPPADAEGDPHRTGQGEFVVLSVEDTGVGMDAETQRQIFEPFFTTKPPELGSGLGLSTVYGIVRQSGGFILVESTPGKGSRFQVFLPVPRREAPAGHAPAGPSRPGGNQATVLLVEDDVTIRRLVPRLLESRGYRVLSAGDGEEALALVSRHDGPLDLIISDVVLPGPSGPEVVERLRALRPGVRVLFTSGYSPDLALRQDVLDARIHFLPKPFTPAELEEGVRQALD